MPLLKVLVLAIVQGLAELLPVSSSAHVVVAEKLMGLDPSAPQMTLLLVMLHTGTMFAVIAYFWKSWKQACVAVAGAWQKFVLHLLLATVLTGVVGLVLKKAIEKTLLRSVGKAEVELMFSHLEWIAPALAAVGLLILLAGFCERRGGKAGDEALSTKQAAWMGLVQGLALPFRGFSRSGSTISIAMLTGVAKAPAEQFSFALAVILTPPVVVREFGRLLHAAHLAAAAGTPLDLHAAIFASLVGMVLSFAAGMLALRWLSSWLEKGRWYLFGLYCLLASLVVFCLHVRGF